MLYAGAHGLAHAPMGACAMLWSHSGNAGAVSGGSGLFGSLLGASSAAALALTCCASLQSYTAEWAYARLGESAYSA